MREITTAIDGRCRLALESRFHYLSTLNAKVMCDVKQWQQTRKDFMYAITVMYN